MQDNKIYKGDCLKLLPKVADDSVKVAIIDPPYFQGLSHNGVKVNFDDLNISRPFFERLLTEVKRVLRPDGGVFFFTDWKAYAFYFPIFDEVVGAKNMIVWNKKSGPGNFYGYSHELILYGQGSNKTIQGRPKGINVWNISGYAAGGGGGRGAKIHPTQKVPAVIEKMIGDISSEGDLVLDPMGGSCTTAEVAKRMKRRFLVFELQQKYVDIGNQRLLNCL